MWYSTGLPAVPVRWVLIRDPEGGFKTQALLCTDLDADPEQVVRWYVMRWQLEVTFQEMRRHLGFETQRQWTELAIVVGFQTVFASSATTDRLGRRSPFMRGLPLCPGRRGGAGS